MTGNNSGLNSFLYTQHAIVIKKFYRAQWIRITLKKTSDTTIPKTGGLHLATSTRRKIIQINPNFPAPINFILSHVGEFSVISRRHPLTDKFVSSCRLFDG